METCSSEGKLMKQFGNPLILRGPTPPPPPPPPPPSSPLLFHDPLLCPNFRNKNPPLILGGRGNYEREHITLKF